MGSAPNRWRAACALVLAAATLAPFGSQTAFANQVLDDKVAFLASTGATSATGPLPNLGQIPGDNVVIGSLTVEVAPGGNGLFVGGGSTVDDFYPERDGNEIALGFEHLQVTSAQPVYAMGFEMVEPNATQASWGGTPVDSTYQVTAYDGATAIWQGVVYPPDDVVSFTGFWSDRPFNRMVIDDVTNDPDNEYFGEFYTATTPAPAAPIAAVTTTGAPAPGTTGTFVAFPDAPAGTSTSVAYVAQVSTGTSGLYGGSLLGAASSPFRIADTTTAVPSGTGTFASFDTVSLAAFPQEPVLPQEPLRAAFVATGTGGAQGVYGATLDPNAPAPFRIADTTTAVPSGTGTFASFDTVSLAGIPQEPVLPQEPLRAAFVATGTEGSQGVYSATVDSSAAASRVRIADLTTPIPAGTGTFSGFGSVSTSAGHTAFYGTGAGGQAGIYLASTLDKVVAVGDTIAGKQVTALRLGADSLGAEFLTFAATFADGTQAVEAVRVGAFPFRGFLGPVDNPPTLNRVKAGKVVPVKFSLGGDRGLGILATGSPSSERVACDPAAPIDDVEATLANARTKLSYAAAPDTYTYAWATDRTWRGTCRRFVLRLVDGSAHVALFRFA